MSRNDKTGYDIKFDDMTYKGKTKWYFYDVPFADVIDAIREYFSQNMITLDGKDNDIWNSLVEFDGVIDDIVYQMTDWLKERCYDDAFEEYKEEVEELLELEAEEEYWNDREKHPEKYADEDDD